MISRNAAAVFEKVGRSSPPRSRAITSQVVTSAKSVAARTTQASQTVFECAARVTMRPGCESLPCVPNHLGHDGEVSDGIRLQARLERFDVDEELVRALHGRRREPTVGRPQL